MTHVDKFCSLFSSLWTVPRQAPCVSSGSGTWYGSPSINSKFYPLILPPEHLLSNGLPIHSLFPPLPPFVLLEYSPAFTSFIHLYWIMCYFPPLHIKIPSGVQHSICNTLLLATELSQLGVGKIGLLTSLLLFSPFSGLSRDKMTPPPFICEMSVLRMGWSSLLLIFPFITASIHSAWSSYHK